MSHVSHVCFDRASGLPVNNSHYTKPLPCLVSVSAVGGYGPTRRGVVGEEAGEPGRIERAPIASERGTRRSEEAKVSEKAVRRKSGGGSPGNLEWAKDGEAEEPV
jgi:hypothetical protein